MCDHKMNVNANQKDNASYSPLKHILSRILPVISVRSILHCILLCGHWVVKSRYRTRGASLFVRQCTIMYTGYHSQVLTSTIATAVAVVHTYIGS
jgi:hypothetical protein